MQGGSAAFSRASARNATGQRGAVGCRGMSLARFKAVRCAWRLDYLLVRERTGETKARVAAGRALRAELGSLPESAGERVRVAWERIDVLEGRERELAGRLASSLQADRQDYRGTSSDWGRWLVVVRGVLDRLVLREEARRARKDLPGYTAELGAAAVLDHELAEKVGDEARGELERTRATIERLERERSELLAPWGGEPLPRWLDVLFEELGTFGGFVWNELTKKFVVRLPALVAMLVAWWLTHHFTTSKIEPGSIERPLVSPEMMDQLQFWLPLIAAALAAYLTAAFSHRIRKRYGETTKSTPAAPSTVATRSQV